MDTDQQPSTSQTRIRSLSEKGREIYENTYREHQTKVNKKWLEVENNISNSSLCNDLVSLQKVESETTETFKDYHILSDNFIEFLHRTNTPDSIRDTESQVTILKAHQLLTENTLTSIKQRIAYIQNQKSDVHSVAKTHSSIKSKLATKRAEAEAAAVGVTFARKETHLRKQKAQLAEKQASLEAELSLIQQEKSAAETAAEVHALQIITDEIDSRAGDFPLPQENAVDRTRAYVESHADHSYQRTADQTDIEYPHILQAGLNPIAPSFTPQMILDPVTTQNESVSTAAELTRFLLKKELLMSRLTTFNDKPELFRVWKAGFISVTQDLHVTPMEELDLLVKWLGSESSQYAQSIRAAHANNPMKGLARLWERLQDRYGSPELVESSIKAKLNSFPKLSNRDNKKLYDLADILSEIEAVKEDEQYKTLLSYFDSSSGITPIVAKLPYNLQEKWTNKAEISKIKNDPSFVYETHTNPPDRHQPIKSQSQKPVVRVRKTDVTPEIKCPIHKSSHSLNECRAFRSKSIVERKAFLKEQGFCYRCCVSTKHVASACNEDVVCAECRSTKHPTALHVNSSNNNPVTSAVTNNGGESSSNQSTSADHVKSKCTQICGQSFRGKSCGKTVLANVFPYDQPEKARRVYAILDDQSNMTLGRSDLFELFSVNTKDVPYTLVSCAGQHSMSGRRAKNLVVQSLDGTQTLKLPTVIECNEIPNLREEIPSPEIAKYHPYLSDIANHIPPLDDQASILLLIGRDVPEIHHVLDQRTGPKGSPYAQKLPMGWVVVGETCIGKIHKSDVVNVNKTHLLRNGRPSLFNPCPNNLFTTCTPTCNERDHSSTVFETTLDDNKKGLSVEDKIFLDLMEKDVVTGPDGNLVAPLPFKPSRPRLPNNRAQAEQRAKALHHSMLKNTSKREHFMEFMNKIFSKNHAEPAPPLKHGEECWYLPIFGVYHPKKPNQIRGVFDSSAQHGGLSLNSVLLRGPDLTNSLLGVLLRFRLSPIASMADIEQMFYGFQVSEEHRNFLRFLWYRDNNIQNELTEFRMRVHVFGNSPSPAVATYGLRQIAKSGEEEFGRDVVDFVNRNFYVDDGLSSHSSPAEAIDLLKRTQRALLKGGNLRLHKIASNSQAVLDAFPREDHAKDLLDLNLSTDIVPPQRSLGITWNIQSDSFTYHVDKADKPYTRRGVLSIVNGIFDPIGFLAPVVIEGKILLREMMSETTDWDQPLQPHKEQEWIHWKDSLQQLQDVDVNRTYCSLPPHETEKHVHIFSDASEKAIAAVVYQKCTHSDRTTHFSFILGKAKVAPQHGHTIPRLELCGAVIAVELAETVSEHLDIPLESMTFHTDSKVTLGYIHNECRRFFIYVANRVARIRKSTSPNQWFYVNTHLNPADDATRSIPASQIGKSAWLLGPKNLQESCPNVESFDLLEPDAEIRPTVIAAKTNISSYSNIGTHRFQRFSSWQRLVETIAHLKHIAQSFHGNGNCIGWHSCSIWKTVSAFHTTELDVIKSVQSEVYSGEMKCIQSKRPIPANSPIAALSPVLGEDNLLRVGGRLNQSSLGIEQTNPLILPGQHHISTLLVLHHHSLTSHQGRHFTEGAVRKAGLWITGGKRLISSLIYKCVTCKKLRGTQMVQKMSDLPSDRLSPAPAFTYVGVDVFGPWSILSRRTRGGQSNDKRWAVLFICLSTRAIHLEVIESMSSSCLINAVRRFISIRGPVARFRSDRGTNFVGATDILRIDSINVEDGPVRDFLYNSGTEWLFNAPHSSHMGGVWERLIGVTRRILDSMLRGPSGTNLTHETLTTFMAEASAIVNSRPLLPVSTDPENPSVLSPATLLHQKTVKGEEPLGDFNLTDMYRAQWKRVQAMADTFWNKWRQEYLHTLQTRRKWQNDHPDLQNNDVILLKEKDSHRNSWPLGIIETILPSADGKIRKAVVRVVKDGKIVSYTRPISEMVLLVTGE